MLRSRRYREDHAQLTREAAELGIRVEEARAELVRTSALADGQLAAEQELDRRRYALNQLEAAQLSLAGERKREWEAALIELRYERARLLTELGQRDLEIALYTVSAPVEGTVEEIASISPGSYVQAGDVVAVISPDAPLFADLYVSAGDVGLIHPGMPVRLHFDAYNYHDWGPGSGTVRDVANDFMLVEDQPSFRVRVSLDQHHLRLRSGVQGEIRKGMTLQGRFLVAERSLLQLLRDDINDWLHPWDSTGSAATEG